MGIFGKDSKSPRDQVKEWESKLRKETYQLDRQIRKIQVEEAKVKQSIKQAAKKGDKDVCLILAKELVASKKAIARIHASKAQINSVVLSMKQQAANIRIAGTLSKSTDVMKAMQSLFRVTEVSQTMQELSREMMKAGIIDEMMSETLDDATGFDEEEMEEAAKKEVDKILFDLTAGTLGNAPEVIHSVPGDKAKAEPVVEEDGEEITEMRKRLEALKS